MPLYLLRQSIFDPCLTTLANPNCFHCAPAEGYFRQREDEKVRSSPDLRIRTYGDPQRTACGSSLPTLPQKKTEGWAPKFVVEA